DAEVAQDSGNYMVYLKRGLQFKELSRVDAAIADFNTCLKLYDETYQDLPEEDTTVIPTEFKYYALYARGLTYALKGNYATASEDLSSAIQWASTVEIADSLVSPTLGNAYLERGYVNFQLENDEEAMKNYEWVIENDPEKACKAHALIAELRLLQKDLTKTVEAYDNLINCNPDDVLLFYSRGFYKGELGLLDEAVTDLSVSAEKSLNSKLRVASHNRIAYLLFKAEEYDRALTAVQAAKDINVLNPISFYYEGLVLLAQNNQSAACEALNKSISYGLTGEELPEAEALVQVNCPTIEE
ncbi:MAG: tetratricopeptide repeat protein, partial [Bacteroidota bacterium]